MQKSNAWWARLRERLVGRISGKKDPIESDSLSAATNGSPKVLVLVEGPNDIQFLRRISAILHADDPTIPDLSNMERRNELVFVPFGGGDLRLWSFRLAGLGSSEFHLYDRDMPPHTESRQEAVDIVNLRPKCRAVLTRKRHLENYLHPRAVCEASGIHAEFSDEDYVADILARHSYDRRPDQMPWSELPARTRKRRRDKVKKWLNTDAVERMTSSLLAERDPDGEVRSWLAMIAELASETA